MGPFCPILLPVPELSLWPPPGALGGPDGSSSKEPAAARAELFPYIAANDPDCMASGGFRMPCCMCATPTTATNWTSRDEHLPESRREVRGAVRSGGGKQASAVLRPSAVLPSPLSLVLSSFCLRPLLIHRLTARTCPRPDFRFEQKPLCVVGPVSGGGFSTKPRQSGPRGSSSSSKCSRPSGS